MFENLFSKSTPRTVDCTPMTEIVIEFIPLTDQQHFKCGKDILEGYYGSWCNAGMCSKTCETIKEHRGKHPFFKSLRRK